MDITPWKQPRTTEDWVRKTLCSLLAESGVIDYSDFFSLIVRYTYSKKRIEIVHFDELVIVKVNGTRRPNFTKYLVLEKKKNVTRLKKIVAWSRSRTRFTNRSRSRNKRSVSRSTLQQKTTNPMIFLNFSPILAMMPFLSIFSLYSHSPILNGPSFTPFEMPTLLLFNWIRSRVSPFILLVNLLNRPQTYFASHSLSRRCGSSRSLSRSLSSNSCPPTIKFIWSNWTWLCWVFFIGCLFMIQSRIPTTNQIPPIQYILAQTGWEHSTNSSTQIFNSFVVTFSISFRRVTSWWNWVFSSLSSRIACRWMKRANTPPSKHNH